MALGRFQDVSSVVLRCTKSSQGSELAAGLPRLRFLTDIESRTPARSIAGHACCVRTMPATPAVGVQVWRSCWPSLLALLEVAQVSRVYEPPVYLQAGILT